MRQAKTGICKLDNPVWVKVSQQTGTEPQA